MKRSLKAPMMEMVHGQLIGPTCVIVGNEPDEIVLAINGLENSASLVR